MGVHAYRFPIRSSPVHTYNRLCFKTTIFTRTGLKAFQNSPSLPLKSKFGRQTCLFKYFYVMVYLKPSQVLSDFGTMLSRSTELGLFGFKSRHNNKLKHLTLRTCFKSLKYELKDTKLAVKHSYPSRDQILLHHRTSAFHSPQGNRENSVLETLSRVQSFRWLRAFLKSNSGYLWTPPDKVFWIQTCQKHVVSFSHECCAVSKNLIFFI